MATFGTTLANAMWPVLRQQRALTRVIVTTRITSIDFETGAITTIEAVETPDALIAPFGPDEVDGVRVAVADRKVLIPTTAIGTPPTVTTTVEIAGEVWEVQVPPERVSNDGLWQLHVRSIGRS